MTRDSNAVPKTLTWRIREKYEALTKAERQLADTILDFPGEVASYSATELAGRAGVSKAAVTRLVRRLGFRNFQEARISSRNARSRGSALYLMSKATRSRARSPTSDDHIGKCLENIQVTFANFSPKTIDEVTSALAKARRIWLIGYRNSYYLAAYTRWQFLQVRDDVHVFPMAGETLGEILASIDRTDVIIIIGIRRRPPWLTKIVECSQRTGAAIVFIGDTHSPAPSDTVTWTLLCETKSLRPLDNHVAPFALMHLLSIGLMERMGNSARRRLNSIEGFHEDLGEI